MSFLTVNHSEAGGFEVVKPGKYECIISKAEITTSNSGNRMVKAQLTIRADVDQEFAGQKLFDNWVESEKAMFKFQQVAKAVELEDGTPVGTLEEFVDAVLYKPVKVSVKADSYNGQPKAAVTFYDVADYDYEGGGEGSRDPFQDDGKPIDISDDDLPF